MGSVDENREVPLEHYENVYQVPKLLQKGDNLSTRPNIEVVDDACVSRGSSRPRILHRSTTPQVVVEKNFFRVSEKDDRSRGVKHEKCCEVQSVEEALAGTPVDLHAQ